MHVYVCLCVCMFHEGGRERLSISNIRELSATAIGNIKWYPAFLPLDIYPGEMETQAFTKTYMSIHSSFNCNNSKLESTRMSINY